MQYKISDVFKSEETKYQITLFKRDEIDWLESKIFEKNGKPYLKCLGSDKDRPAKPEEIVRQLWIKKILDDFHYPKERLLIEKPVQFGSGVSDKSADIVIKHINSDDPYIIFEIKKPNRKDGLKQLKSYCNADGSPIGVWSNGGEKIVLHRELPNIFQNIDEIPTVDQTLQDVIGQPWTIDKLKEEDRLVRERLSLKKIILDLEDLVLANAKGIDDSFDEVFKLVYAKLYDEWAAVNLKERNRKIQFRIYGESPSQLYDKINGLFGKAINQWRGVFATNEKIILTPSHLQVCVSFLQGVKLFNANLQVIDDAFEYLSTTVAKKSKGQYFTPRWVIDMCVKMLDPKIDEKLIDPACGSSGFTVHSIFWVAGEQFTAEGLPRPIVEYAGNNVFGIDSSPKAVKIAKALNLIAGDGKTNIYELNSLDSPTWDDTGKAAFRNMLTRYENRADDQDNQRNFKFFDFDVLMTNPPFAGPIGEKDILRQYKLADKKGKPVAKLGRDILFIEKCLNFLRQGGRCAIILPQGRLNNSSDIYIRNFILERAKLLAVVGLHGNTFQPHTGTKTSALFIQKYTDEEIEEINEIVSRHTEDWENHFISVKELSQKEILLEDEVPETLLSELSLIFDETEDLDIDESTEDENIEQPTLEELIEEISEWEADLFKKPPRFKGKTDFIRILDEKKRKLASFTLKGKINWLINNKKLLEDYRKNWLNVYSTKELDYPIFFAVSERPGKDSKGDLIYKRDLNGKIMLDEHGHLFIDHDLNEIAEAFSIFKLEQGFNF